MRLQRIRVARFARNGSPLNAQPLGGARVRIARTVGEAW